MKIGIVGMGMVGSAYKEALTRKGFELATYDKFNHNYHEDFQVIESTDAVFLCLPTIPKEDGRLDITPILEVMYKLHEIKYKGLIILKSTVLPGTTKELRKTYKLNIVHSPEYLAESTAVYNVLNPERIVLGVPDNKVNTDLFYKLHYVFTTPITKVDSNTSEFSKFMENTFFATKVTFANEMNEIAQIYKADYDTAKDILYKCSMIGNNHLKINKNRNYGGHCLPKDTNQLITDLEINHGVKPLLLKKVQEINKRDTKLFNKSDVEALQFKGRR